MYNVYIYTLYTHYTHCTRVHYTLYTHYYYTTHITHTHTYICIYTQKYSTLIDKEIQYTEQNIGKRKQNEQLE